MKQLASNARWLALAQLGKVGIQLISITVLARLLEPRYYGLTAIAAAVTAFASLFRDLGTTAALIQARELTEETKSTAFWISVSMGSALCLIMLTAAYPAARYFAEPELTWVFVLVAFTFPLSALSAVPSTLLERAGRFRELTVVEVGIQALGLGLAIALALAGAGVYSLVAPSVVATALTTLCIYRLNPWRPTRKTTRTAWQSMARFSANLTGFNIINYFARNADTLIIGKLLGAGPLGIYATSMKLMLFPLQSITYVSNRALFPVLSQAQNEPETFSTLYLNTVRFVSLLTFPLMLGLWVSREPFVQAMYGARWLGMVDVLSWLTPVGVIQSINSTTGTVFMARGRTDTLLYLGVFSAVLQVGAFWIGAQRGMTEVAKLYLVANVFCALPSFYLVMRLAHISPATGLRALAPATAAAALMCAACALTSHLVGTRLPPAGHLLALVAVGVLVYAGTLKWGFPASWARVRGSLRRHTPGNA